MTQPEFPPGLVSSLRALEGVIPLQDDLGATLTKLSHAATLLIPGCDSASVTLMEDDGPRTPGATDDVVIELDHVQYRTGEGPCLDSIREQQIIKAGDLSSDDRWGAFPNATVKAGFFSCLSVPLPSSDATEGGLNLYGRKINGFDGVPSELLDLLVMRASVTIQNTIIYAASKKLIEELNEAIRTRELIGEAKGILMEREQVTEEAAFQILVAASQNSNVKLREIAQRVVDQATQPDRTNGS